MHHAIICPCVRNPKEFLVFLFDLRSWQICLYHKKQQHGCRAFSFMNLYRLSFLIVNYTTPHIHQIAALQLLGSKRKIHLSVLT